MYKIKINRIKTTWRFIFKNIHQSHCGSDAVWNNNSTWIKVNVPTVLSAIHSKPEAELWRRGRLGRSEYKGQLVSDHQHVNFSNQNAFNAATWKHQIKRHQKKKIPFCSLFWRGVRCHPVACKSPPAYKHNAPTVCSHNVDKHLETLREVTRVKVEPLLFVSLFDLRF